VQQPTLGQAVVAIGEAQKALDRLLENPGGAWATVENLSVIACALCTAAGGHAATVQLAIAMLETVIESTRLTDPERAGVRHSFQRAKVPLDPLAVLRGFALGLNGKREQELMLVREAIVANTDRALEADVTKAAEAMLQVLDDYERRDAHGRMQPISNFADLGIFFYYIWRRVARYGFDSSQHSEAHQYTFFLFNGATYEHGKRRQFASKAKEHVRLVVSALANCPQLGGRASSLAAKCTSSDLLARALSEMQESMTNDDKLAGCGLLSLEEFDRALDTGNYIGFTNGVYDIQNDHFFPKGRVPFNVLVCKTTRYAYVGTDDPQFASKRVEIQEFYRTLHADNYNDPDDANLATMWMLAGSFLMRGNSYKKVIVFLGSEGDNGKSTFTELIQLTLGDYAVTGNRRSLSGNFDQDTLDPDLVANHKSLLCVFPEVQSNEGGVSCGFKFNCGKLKALTGQDEQTGRGLYRDARCYTIGFVPLVHTNLMPMVDGNDTAASNRLWVARFDSRFPAGITVPNLACRMYPRIENIKERMREWAPYHFALMLDGLREFRRRNSVLPPGAQTIVGSFAHQALAAQTADGKLRAWVEGHLERVPLDEKDRGSKLEELHGEYLRAGVHARLLGKTTFKNMLVELYPDVGPHRNTPGTANLYLLR
jgi:hypothetical protein